MKNYKQYGIIGFLLFLILVFILICCDNNDNTEETNIIDVGTIDVGGVDIKITKMAGITDEQVNVAINSLEEYMLYWGSPMKNKFNTEITEICLATSGTIISHNETILTMAWNASLDEFMYYLMINNLV